MDRRKAPCLTHLQQLLLFEEYEEHSSTWNLEQHIGLGWCLTSYKHVIQTRKKREPGILHLFAQKLDAAGVCISGSKTMALMDSSP